MSLNPSLRAYEALTPTEKKIVQLIAIAHAPITRSNLFKCMSELEIKTAQNYLFTMPLLQDLFKRWEVQKILLVFPKGVQCSAYVSEVAVRDSLQTGFFERAVSTLEQVVPPPMDSYRKVRDWTHRSLLERDLRIALYRDDIETIEALATGYQQATRQTLNAPLILLTFVQRSFDAEWFATLSPELAFVILYTGLQQAFLKLEPAENLLEVLQAGCLQPQGAYRRSLGLVSLLTEQLLLQGRLREAREAIDLLRHNFDLPADRAANSATNSALESPKITRKSLSRTAIKPASQEDKKLDSPAGKHRISLLMYQAWLHFLDGNPAAAIESFEGARQLAVPPGKSKKRQPVPLFLGIEGIIFVFSLLQEGSIASQKIALEYLEAASNNFGSPWQSTYETLLALLLIQQGNLALKTKIAKLTLKSTYNVNFLQTFIFCLCRYAVNSETAKSEEVLEQLQKIYHGAIKTGHDWLALEVATLLAQLFGENNANFEHWAKTVREMGELATATLLTDVVKPRPAWEIQLAALAALHPAASGAAPTAIEGDDRRLVWFVDLAADYLRLEPREQKRSVKGGWSGGRVISLKRLYQEASQLEYLTPQDHRICSQITVDRSYRSYYGSESYYEFLPQAALELVGDPLVFWASAPSTKVEIVTGQLQLIVRHGSQGQLSLELLPLFNESQRVVVQRESPTRLKVIAVNEKHQQIANIFNGSAQISVPAAAQAQVLAAIEALAGSISVQSDIGGVANIESIPPDPTPHIHLLPAQPGLKLSLLARPFRSGGPYFFPGSGGTTAIADLDGKQVQTTRDLAAERQQASALLAACPTLARLSGFAGDIALLESEPEWQLEDPVDCLEVLSELQALQSPPEGAPPPPVQPVVEWPEGEKLRISHQAGLSNFKVSIERQRDWFAADGQLRLDDDTVLDMQRLLQLLASSPGRFVQIGDGQFVALTKEFQRQLQALRSISENHGSGVRFHPLASLAIEDTLSELGELSGDRHWHDHVQKIREMRDLHVEVPSTLQADLRDYQIDGFRWLMRLAHWGVGACLADDMGLGKTLQCLAAILCRAAEGPTLVVAPTSVATNWLSEAARFAPTLNAVVFGTGDRQKVLDELQPRDLVICSYGLLQQAEAGEMLAQVDWTTVILDEAQAIKNSATQRSKAAMNLKGQFRIAVTGTPIENHLGELWNLFRFINPGLLGSQEKFNQRFAGPIERYQDPAARRNLKKLIQPFILRRTKNQVLQELPSRTEILLPIDLSPEETALYEATRRQAIAKLAETDQDNSGAQHLRVLAEIMRLRRLCCNPNLVLPEANVSSSKLQVFGETIDELLENRHKVLVFSQFVDHLSILREYLDEKKITYQYLDGSTPSAQRKQRVDAFQGGEGDVFLISLKAGGTGLNLTAADYVIHMDPWWNPAVEDQASDRAHRIGQQRPVTIYRLVARGTIEEKIVDLHASKRDLADSLLEGSDVSGKLSTNDLLKLIASDF